MDFAFGGAFPDLELNRLRSSPSGEIRQPDQHKEPSARTPNQRLSQRKMRQCRHDEREIPATFKVLVAGDLKLDRSVARG